MLPDVGIQLPSPILPSGQLQKVRDIEYYEGSLLSEFRSDRGETFIRYWCISDGIVNRWLIFRAIPIDIIRYTYQKINLLDLIRCSQDGFAYVVDIAEKKMTRVAWTPIKELPKSYLPSEDSYFDPDCSPPDGQNDRVHDVLLDGTWELQDLSDFPKKFSQIYSFLFFTNHGHRSEDLRHVFASYRWRGGYVSGTFYRELGKLIPYADRPSVKAMQYASPGFIRLRLQKETAQLITQAVSRFIESQPTLAPVYRAIQDWIHGRVQREESGKTEDIQTLADRLGFVDGKMLLELTKEPVLAARILSSYYRRIENLAAFQREGKATFL